MAAKVFLVGYFGSGNIGDDAILLAFNKATEHLNLHTQVLCGNVEKLSRNYGLRGVLKTDMNRVKDAIKECDAVVFPGGSIFQDVTSVRSAIYYSEIVKIAKKEKKKVVMLGQGVGPLKKFLSKRAAIGAFNQVDMLCVRDRDSVTTLKELGVKPTPRLTADMAFLLPKPTLSEDSGSFGVAGMKSIGISARPFGKTKEVVDMFGELIKRLSAAGYVPTMIALDEQDEQIVQAIAKAHGGKVPELKGVSHPVQLQQRIARMEAVISMRLHGGILATTVGVPPYMISYDPKVSAFCNNMGFPAPPKIEGLTADRVLHGFTDFIKDRDRLAASLEKRREEQAKAAQGNIDAFSTALGL